MDDTTRAFKGYVSFKKCKEVFAHDKQKSGTTKLFNHIKVCESKCRKILDLNRKQSEHTTGFVKSQNSLPIILYTGRETKRAGVDFIAADLHSYKAVEEKGLDFRVQKVITVGAKYSNVAASDILLSRNTIKSEGL